MARGTREQQAKWSATYRATAYGKATRLARKAVDDTRYFSSPKGRAALARYAATDKGKVAKERYRVSPKGRLAAKRSAHRRRARMTDPGAYIARLELMLGNHEPCNHCGMTAEQIDHILPLALGGTDDWYNLQPLCKSCHKVKTDADLRNVMRSRRG